MSYLKSGVEMMFASFKLDANKNNAVHSVNIGTTQQISISDHKTQRTEFGSLKLLQNVFA